VSTFSREIKRDSKTNLELLERDLSLKQLQINRLLEVTQAINNNLTADALFKIYRSILGWEMKIDKMALFIKEEDWIAATSIGFDEAIPLDYIGFELLKYERMTNLLDNDHPIVGQFDIVIPVYHKNEAIAFALIGNLDSDEDMYEKIRFITTITNIIAVAIENKRLFNRQLEQEMIKKEMQLAKQMQNLLIPSELPHNKHYELDGIYMPHSSVGGDYFDFIKFNDEEFAFCIADVSGKGVAAALLMANFQANLQSLIVQRLEAEEFIQRLNKSVLKITKGDKFLTFFYGEYNIKTKKLAYVNAGHNPPVLVTNGEVTLLDRGCTILGIFDKIPTIELGKLTLEKDALIINYTDGLTDLQNEEEDYFDVDLLSDFAVDNCDANAEDFNNRLLSRIRKFKGKMTFPDDISVLTCKIFNKKNKV
jgi:sigma-B regulation protein RsbU (phosphoserine phosphatase)